MTRLRDRVVVLTPGESVEYDWHGNPIPGPATEVEESAAVQGVSATENTVAAQTVVSRYSLLLLPGTTATAASQIRWRGNLYDIDGDVLVCSDRHARPHHCEALMVRVTG